MILQLCIQSKFDFHRYTNELLNSVERLCLPCDMSGDVLKYNNQYFRRWQPSVEANYNVSVKKILIRGLISACLKHVVKLDGLALGVLYGFRFDFFTFCNSYGRLIRRKGLLIPFVSISLFFCRSNWLTEVDLSNRKTAFNKASPSFQFFSYLVIS